MDRKKTILIAVLINAGLLVLLFVVALHHDEATPKSVEMAQASAPETQPLFNDIPLLTESPLAQPMSETAQPDSLVQIAAQPLGATALPSAPLASETSAEIVHQLPPLASQDIPAPLASIAPAASPAASLTAALPLEIKVKRGDSLEKIAKVHRTSVDEIIRLNHLPSSFLRIGQVLKLPSERTMHNTVKPKTLIADRGLNEGHPEYYTVRVGDNPWTIAMKHHMKVDELLKVNNLNEEKARRLKPGDRLRIR
jgi:peptidoglycan DL-endopeptidase LytF